MGNGMNKIITGIYVGNFRDAKDIEKLNENNITHILSIHDYAKPLHEDKKYLCINASDTPQQSLTEYFEECIEFIHKARLEKGNVLVHCLAGVSRSVTVTAAYIMTVTKLGWRDSINAIRGARSVANPNFGFQKQLQVYENEGLDKARLDLKARYPQSDFNDDKECENLLKCFNNFLMTGETRAPPELYSLPHRAYSGRNKDDKDNINTAKAFGEMEFGANGDGNKKDNDGSAIVSVNNEESANDKTANSKYEADVESSKNAVKEGANNDSNKTDDTTNNEGTTNSVPDTDDNSS
ncbi:Dual specificity protein phosphatase 22 [Mactra antiquata]